MSWLGCWKVHWIFYIEYLYRSFLLYSPISLYSPLYSRYDATGCTIEFFLWRWLTIRRPVSRAVPDPWFSRRRRILIPERSERHWTTRPNYDGIYEPLRHMPRKISNLDIYLLRPRASQIGPSNVGLLCRERFFSSTPRRRCGANNRLSNYSSTVVVISRHFSW